MSNADGDAPVGLAVVDKPAGWTSHDVVARARRLLGTRKVGHAGTLDPDATGVLLLGVGRATRLLRYLTGLPKTYETDIVLGEETDTLDASGTTTATHDMSGVTLDEVRRAAATLTGDLEQIPPMVSAVRVGGRRLHELAREGIEVERAARPVHVERFDVDALTDPGEPPLRLRAVVTCSSGTYVRVLAADLGSALGGGAHLDNLRRTAVGPFALDEAVALDDLGTGSLLDPGEALRWLPSVSVDADTATVVGHGRVLPLDEVAPPGEQPPERWRVLGPDGRLLAVYRVHTGGRARPEVVLVGG
jgi:tRNA pseudouridine55 synthase